MTGNDFKLLGKKILIGVVIGIIPLILIAGGLWLTKTLLGTGKSPQSLTAK
jgi:hypothetical protein